MSQWGNTDDAANSVIWAPAQLKTSANSTTRDALFGNTTADALIAGITVGQYGVDTNESQAARAGAGDKVAHAGWVLRTEGSGGRSGRVQHETLVAMGTITGDASDDAVFEDYTISIATQPQDVSANSADDSQATFTIVSTSTPATTLSFLWQYTSDAGNTDTWATTAAVSGFSGQTSNTLTVDANTIADGTLVRVLVSKTGADTVTSDSAELTVTS